TAAVCPDGRGFAVTSHVRDNDDPMSMPTWWNQRRFGIFVHSNLATVPAWSPIGEYSDWYRSHLGEDVADVVLHPRPMVEVLAHHRDRWGHIERFDDFLPLLTYDRFDAEDWARLVTDAGAGYSILVAKHHDGWCWWDAPNTDRTMLHGGPRRNVLAEYAAACERNDIVFGTYYSLLDWGDARFPDPSYVSEVLHSHVVDLVERYGSSVLWGDGHWGHGPELWRTGELLDRIRAIDPDVVVNDRWWAAADHIPAGRPPLVRTFEYETPDEITEGPWELCRGIGASFCHNRAERAEHHMSGFDIVALLTEVIAKGGHLLLNVGPAADGTIPELQRAPLESAGRWIRAHQQLIDRSVPWDSWGDAEVRYLCLDGHVHVVDLSGRGRFSAITPDRYRVSSVERDGSPVRFSQHDDGLHVDGGRSALERRTRAGRVEDVSVYRVTLAPVEQPVELFEPQPRRPIELPPLLSDARPGDIVQLGDGTYLGPITVPAGVIVRGLGGGRTTIDGGGATAVVLERNARLEHLRVGGGPNRLAWFPCPAVEVRGPYATLLGCRVDGHVIVRADDVVIRATAASGVVADGADRLTVSRSQFRGMRWDVGVHLIDGAGHEIDSCEFRDHLCGIRATDTTGTIVRGNNIVARWWGIHLEQTEGAHVYGNFVDHTMRGIDIDGGTQAVIDGNAICDGDSGCIVEWGASDCQVSGNRWERCRIGILAWEVTALHAHDNEAIDLHEPDAAHATGP
ncbi:MAG TPA: alpha-L-fucosidase, partial [Ilumatobacteraceae bacterium]|nr:alpha-L-fucosidase [Ilumatobacteraceae bacterium]